MRDPQPSRNASQPVDIHHEVMIKALVLVRGQLHRRPKDNDIKEQFSHIKETLKGPLLHRSECV
jgi:hypothetical protein